MLKVAAVTAEISVNGLIMNYIAVYLMLNQKIFRILNLLAAELERLISWSYLPVTVIKHLAWLRGLIVQIFRHDGQGDPTHDHDIGVNDYPTLPGGVFMNLSAPGGGGASLRRLKPPVNGIERIAKEAKK